MDKTKVDEMLISMIAPKLKEIEERFSAGKGLNNDDVNTLLLKSQFNHINHLDMRLGEVTADVSGLKLDFAGLKSEFAGLSADVKIEISNLKTDVQQAINRNMQWSIGLITFIITAFKIVDMIWGR